ncbi:MAG TPA: hypothetical protein VFE36_01390, partial [Candidatus Baltobacteraceae bacterium]|nr:hypothetical protein [Candidatus Baltobacteraceae bacterium]
MIPSPSPSPGPCTQGAVASISDRPGLGRAPATNGAACVALPGTVLIEAGYRNQTTAGSGTQTLSTVPNVVVRVGLRGKNEIVAAPPAFSSRNGIDLASGFSPASGTQDVGIGFKHLLFDGQVVQHALNLFVTLPTGSPNSASGFTAGLPTYTLGYSVVVAASSRVGFSTTQNFIANAAPNASGSPQRFFTYQPAIAGSYALSPSFTLLLQNQWSFPSGPGAGAGDRALAGLQFSASPNVVLDGEFEANLLPAPGLSQHA